jgi:hypothetical protein
VGNEEFLETMDFPSQEYGLQENTFDGDDEGLLSHLRCKKIYPRGDRVIIVCKKIACLSWHGRGLN